MKKIGIIILAICGIILIAIGILQLKKNNPSTPSMEEKLFFTVSELYLVPDQEEQLIVTNSNGDELTENLFWESGNEDIATVDQKGRVIGVKEGKTIITVTDNKNRKATCGVSVTEESVAITSIKMKDEKISVTEKQETELLLIIEPENATERDFVWTSSDPEIAKVDEKGKVTGIKEGTVTITAETDNGLKATCEVSVVKEKVEVEKLTLSQTAISLTPNSEFQLNVTIEPKETTERDLVWASSDDKIATVTQTGKVKAIKKGTATITVKSKNDKKASVKVTVTTKAVEVSSLSFSKQTVNLHPEETEQLMITISPENATERTLTWTSSNPAIVTVDANGKVKAIKAGQVTITATSKNNKKATCTVKVTNIEAVNIITESSLSLKPGEQHKLRVNFVPQNTTDKTLTFVSTNPAVATVSETGLVTGVGLGRANIIVSTSNNVQKSIPVEVPIKNLGKITLTNPIFQVETRGSNNQAGGLAVTQNHYIACKSDTSGSSATIFFYKRSDNTLDKDYTFSNQLGACNDLGYNSETGNIVLSGSRNALSYPDLLEGTITDGNANLNNSPLGIEFDHSNGQYYTWINPSKNRIVTFQRNLSQLKAFDAVAKQSKGLGSYNGKILVTRFNSATAVEDVQDLYSYRNSMDVYQASTGEYVGTYFFAVGSGYPETYTEIEDIAYSGSGSKFYIYYSFGYVFEVNLSFS